MMIKMAGSKLSVLLSVLVVLVGFAAARLGDERDLQSTNLLKLCEGDCDSDNDCVAGLRCFHRQPNQLIVICDGSGNDASKTDYCVPAGVSDDALTLSLDTGGGSGPPFGKCKGDCDSDADCESGLVCFQRESNQPVPGCRGSDGSRSDYCIDPADQTPGSSFANTYKQPITLTMQYKISDDATNRQPTDEEYRGVTRATDKWLTDQTDSIFNTDSIDLARVETSSVDEEYIRGEEYTHKIVYEVDVYWNANNQADIPLNSEYLNAFRSGQTPSFDLMAYRSEYLTNSSPENSIFRSTIGVDTSAVQNGQTEQVF